MLVFIFSALLYSVKSTPCEVAKKTCYHHSQCSVAMGNYIVHCGDYMAGRSLHCSDACKKSMVALSETESGKSLSTCDCEDDRICRLDRDRMEACEEDTGQEADCREAAWVCAADHNCSIALASYRKRCMVLVHRQECTNECEKSFHDLKGIEKASDIFSCECTGIEDYPCHQTVLELCGRIWRLGTHEAVHSSSEGSLLFDRIFVLYLTLALGLLL